jgi:hypothetical protein
MEEVAIVTGGTRGIGAAIAIALKTRGYRVAANYVGNEERARTFTGSSGIPSYKWDVADFEDCKRGVAEVERDLGPIDIVINNAGITRDATLKNMTPACGITSKPTNRKGTITNTSVMPAKPSSNSGRRFCGFPVTAAPITNRTPTMRIIATTADCRMVAVLMPMMLIAVITTEPAIPTRTQVRYTSQPATDHRKTLSNDELTQLTHTIAHRVGRYLERQGLLVRDSDQSYFTADAVEKVRPGTGREAGLGYAQHQERVPWGISKPALSAVVMSRSYPKHSLRSRGRLSLVSPEGAYSRRRPSSYSEDTRPP